MLNITEQVPSSEGDCSTSQSREAQVFSALLSHPSAEGVVLAVFEPGEQVDGDVFEGVSPNRASLFGQLFHPTLVPTLSEPHPIVRLLWWKWGGSLLDPTHSFRS